MDERYLRELLEKVRNGSEEIDDALEELKDMPYKDIGFASLDNHRAIRTGFPEVVFCQGKTPEQIGRIMYELSAHGGDIIGTRAEPGDYRAVAEMIPSAVYHDTARIIHIKDARKKDAGTETAGSVAVVTAGTSDIPVAEEAAVTAELMGNRTDRIYDVGVAGIHRLFAKLDRIRAADVVIVIAGMEGALASVVGGLVDRPVIAVPSSVGYGAGAGGIAALLSMLNSCADGVGVVNIDNGYGAAYLASVINRKK